jgi:hypothetical protein
VNLAKNGKIYEYYRCAKTAGKPACKGQSIKGERVTAAITALVEDGVPPSGVAGILT